MVDFKTPNLCGANTDFNSLVSKFVDIENVLTDNLNVDASALSGLLSPELTTLEGNLREMAPAAPELPNINLQSQITDLVNIDTSSVEGVSKSLGSLASITSNFDTGISAAGYSLTDIVSAASTALSGDGNLCAAIPNFEMPAAGGAPVEKAANVLQASADPQRAALEVSSILNKNSNVTDAKTAVESKAATWVNPDIKTVPTEDTGAYKVATKSKSVTYGRTGARQDPDNQPHGAAHNAPESSTVETVEVTTPRDATDGTKRKNISAVGHSTRPESKKVFVKESDLRYYMPSAETMAFGEKHLSPEKAKIWGTVPREVYDLDVTPTKVVVLGYDPGQPPDPTNPKVTPGGGAFIELVSQKEMQEGLFFAWVEGVYDAFMIDSKSAGSNTVTIVPMNYKFAPCPTTDPRTKLHGVKYIMKIYYNDVYDPNYSK
jgi:hypothetical protein